MNNTRKEILNKLWNGQLKVKATNENIYTLKGKIEIEKRIDGDIYKVYKFYNNKKIVRQVINDDIDKLINYWVKNKMIVD